MITLLTTPGLRLMGAARLEGMQRVGEGWEWKRGGKRGEETGRGGNGNGGRLDCLREEEAQKNLFERSRYRYSHFLKPSLYIYMLLFFSLSFFWVSFDSTSEVRMCLSGSPVHPCGIRVCFHWAHVRFLSCFISSVFEISYEILTFTL